MIVVDLIYNLSLLVALSVVSGFIGQRWRRGLRGALLQGLVFGVATVIGMLRPLVMGPGLIFDGRSVMISLCALFFGEPAVGVAGAMAVVCRVAQGGVGVSMGVLVVVASAVLGLAAHHRWIRKDIEPTTAHLLGLGILVHVTMLACTLALPRELMVTVLQRVGPPVMLTYPLATVLIGRILADQAARATAVEALRQSEERYRSLAEDMPVFVTSALPDGTLTYVNRATVAMSGCSREELLGVSFLEFLDEEERELVRGRYAGLSPESPVESHEQCLVGPEGGKRWQVWTSRAFFDSLGRLVRIQSVGMDITDRKRAEAEREYLADQVRQAQKMESVGRLAGGVAHDLNNLLTPILACGELLKVALGEDPRYRDMVDLVLRAGQRARDLVRQLLAFGRKQVLEFRVLDVNETLRGFEPLLRRTIHEDIVIRYRLAPSLPPVRGDVGQIEQVVMNLVVNAQDAMPQGGEITIETDLASPQGEEAGLYVMLVVRDSGHGMDAQTLARVFEPFFTTKPAGKGTGLGLATCHGIVRQHGGHICVESEVGRGTACRVYLPVTEPAASKSVLQAAPAPCVGANRTILLVEDDDMVRQTAHGILSGEGYTVLVATSGGEALECVDRHEGPIHLLLSDVVMPEMDGRELAERVLRKRSEVQVLHMSGYVGDDVARRGVQEEGRHFIAKPFTAQGLIGRVREILEGGRQS